MEEETTEVTEQKIVPHLWFDKEAKEAADFYASVFPDSKITSISTLHDTPLGTAMLFRLLSLGTRSCLSTLGRYSSSMRPFLSW